MQLLLFLLPLPLFLCLLKKTRDERESFIQRNDKRPSGSSGVLIITMHCRCRLLYSLSCSLYASYSSNMIIYQQQLYFSPFKMLIIHFILVSLNFLCFCFCFYFHSYSYSYSCFYFYFYFYLQTQLNVRKASERNPLLT